MEHGVYNLAYCIVAHLFCFILFLWIFLRLYLYSTK